jgi:anaerobic magnesium-protoporphyrin IX monomethyl ester cyclase
MKIILADSHGPIMGKDQTSANLSLLYLGSYLRKYSRKNFDLKYIPQAKSDQFHIDTIESFDADIYAVSFTSFSAVVTYDLIQKIKKRFPHVLVVCGGPHATNASEEILLKSGADICAIGEGEQTFLEIVENLETIHQSKSKIKGICYLENKKYVATPVRELIDDLDSIPFPARDLVDDNDFCGLTYSKSRPNTEMVVTRGCPLRCVFCANPVFRLKNGPLYRARSPKNIAEEAEQLYQLGYREIYIHSDELNVKLDWSIEVCKELAALGHKDLFFQCNLRVVPMSEEFAYWLKQANFWLVRIGLETTSDRVLSGIRKKMSFDKTVTACRILSKAGIKVFGFTMLFNYWEENGELQHETAEEVNQTIKDMYKLWRQKYLHYTSWAFACPVQGSELYDIAIKHKMIDENYYPGDTWDSFNHLRGISKKEFNKLYARAIRQQAIMALTSGNFEWRNYKGIARKALTMLRGRPEV